MRRGSALLVVAVAVLAVTGTVVASDVQTVSIHTMETDFDVGETNGFTIENTGEAAQLAWRGGDTGTALALSTGTDRNKQAKVGIEIVPQQQLHGVEVDVSTGTEAYLLDSGGSVLAQSSVSSGSATLTVSNELQSGETYYVATDQSGSTFSATTLNENTSSTSELSLTGNGYDGGEGGQVNVQYEITSIAGIAATPDTEYVSTSHAAENVQAGFVDLGTVADAEATVTWQGYDGSQWVDVATQTYTTAGNKSLSLSGGYSDWRVRVATTETSINTYDVTVEDEGVTADTAAPSVDNSSASPQGGTTVTSAPTLSIDGSDADFGTVQGDTVTVDWYINGSQVATTTETSSGTWSYDPETAAGGVEWHVEVSDSYGHTAQSETFTFTAPSELRIYNESAPNSLVDDAEVEIRYFFDEDDPENSLVVTRTTSDGTVDMSGLPADKPFIVVAEADGYESRRIYLRSLFEAQGIYLLPSSEESATVTFDLQDYSGDFPDDNTVLLIQRALDDNWETVHGDRFGAAGEFPATLRYSARHRLILVNTETGAERVVGSYTPLTNSAQTITVQSDGGATLASDVRVTVEPGLRRVQNGSDVDVSATIASDDGDLSSYEVRYLYAPPDGTPSDTLAVATGSQPTGETVSRSIDLSDRDGGQLIVEVNYTMTDGTTKTETVAYRIIDSYGNEYGLLPTLQSVPNLLDDGTADMVMTLIAVLTTLVVLGAVGSMGAPTEAVGMSGVLTLAGFGVIGWIGYGLVFAAAGAWVAMSALRRVV